MKEHFLCGAQGLAIGYGKTPLLSDICLGVQPGQILTLIGPNGACKSTLLRTLAGQLAPMGGTVLLEGRSLAGYTGTQRAQKLALMAPHSRRMELTTCFDFVSAGRYPYTGRLGILSAEDRQQVNRALELVGAAQLADRDFNRISDGQIYRYLDNVTDTSKTGKSITLSITIWGYPSRFSHYTRKRLRKRLRVYTIAVFSFVRTFAP